MRSEELKELTRVELMELAKEHEVPNRSRLSKDDLILALKKVTRASTPRQVTPREAAPRETQKRTTSAPRAAAATPRPPRKAASEERETGLGGPESPTATPVKRRMKATTESATAPKSAAPVPPVQVPLGQVPPGQPSAPPVRTEASARPVPPPAILSQSPLGVAPRVESRGPEGAEGNRAARGPGDHGHQRPEHRRHDRVERERRPNAEDPESQNRDTQSRDPQNRDPQNREPQGRPAHDRHQQPRDPQLRNPGRGGPNRADDQEDEIDPWNSVNLGRDPNYGRFLNDPNALGVGRGGNRGNRPGRGNMGRPGGNVLPQSESLLDRSERGRNRAVERTHVGRNERGSWRGGEGPGRNDGPGRNEGPNRRDDSRGRSDRMRDDLRRSGDARRGSGYTPQFQRPGREPGIPNRAVDPRQGRDWTSPGQPPRDGNPGNRVPGQHGQGGGNRRNDRRDGRQRDQRGGEGRPGAQSPEELRAQEMRAGANRPPEARLESTTRGQEAGFSGELRRIEATDLESRHDRDEWGRRAGRRAARPDGRPVDDETRESLRFKSAHWGTRNPALPEPVETPRTPGGDQITVIARDPSWLFAQWEITERTIEHVMAQLKNEWEGCKGVLRVHRLDAADRSSGVRDVVVDEDATSWYIHTEEPDQKYRVEVGVLAPSGTFLALATSGVVVSPPAKVNEGTDQAWADLPPPERAAQGSPERAAQGLSERAAQSRARTGDPDPTGSEPKRGEIIEHARERGEWEGGLEDERSARDEWAESAIAWRVLPPVEPRSEAPADTGPTAKGAIEAGSTGPVSTGPGSTGPGSIEHGSIDPDAAALESIDAVRPRSGWSPGAEGDLEDESREANPEQTSGGREFRLAINTELVIYGITDPNVQLSIEGKPVTIRPDGTFTLRLALPDGTHQLPAVAVSPDGSRTQRIALMVSRSTSRPDGGGRRGREQRGRYDHRHGNREQLGRDPSDPERSDRERSDRESGDRPRGGRPRSGGGRSRRRR
ncbi:MAG: DUF4912 domain-containing protein [Candidatus Eisenbacteria bacterium]|nr:DUF4912 domain-containing protein [Candidatus Eisenbacteria bacterium]